MMVVGLGLGVTVIMLPVGIVTLASSASQFLWPEYSRGSNT